MTMTIGRRLARLCAWLIVIGVALVLLAEAVALLDLFGFEFAPLFTLIGVRGIVTIAIIEAGLIVLALRALSYVLSRDPPFRPAGNVVMIVAAVTGLWVLEYVFMEKPLTVRLT